MSISSFLTKKNQLIIGAVFLCVLIFTIVAVLLYVTLKTEDILFNVSLTDARGVAELHLANENNQTQIKKIVNSERFKEYVTKYVDTPKLVEVFVPMLKKISNTLDVVLYDNGILFVYSETDNIKLEQLRIFLSKDFSLKQQGNILFFTLRDSQNLLENVKDKKVVHEQDKNFFSRDLFDRNSLLSFQVPTGQSMEKIYALVKNQDIYQQALIRNIFRPLQLSFQGNLHLNNQNDIEVSLRFLGDKNILEKISNRSKINLDVVSTLPFNVKNFVVYVNTVDGYKKAYDILTQIGGQPLGALINKVQDQITSSYPLLSSLENISILLGNQSVVVGMNSTGVLFLQTSVQEKDNNVQKLYEYFLNDVKNKQAYEQKIEKLPDGSKSIMLQSHPEKVYEKQENLSGAVIKEVFFNEEQRFLFGLANNKNIFLSGQSKFSDKKLSLDAKVLEYFKEPYHLFFYYSISDNEAISSGVAFQPDGIFCKILLPLE